MKSERNIFGPFQVEHQLLLLSGIQGILRRGCVCMCALQSRWENANETQTYRNFLAGKEMNPCYLPLHIRKGSDTKEWLQLQSRARPAWSFEMVSSGFLSTVEQMCEPWGAKAVCTIVLCSRQSFRRFPSPSSSFLFCFCGGFTLWVEGSQVIELIMIFFLVLVMN